MSDFLSNVKSKLNILTYSQKKVALYLLDNIDSVAFVRLDDLARKIDVSTTTIIRFARILGYAGYAEMQKAIQGEIREKVSLPIRFSQVTNKIAPDKLLKSSFKIDIQNIQDTFDAIDHGELSKAVDYIVKAENLYILGFRSSFALSFYMTSRLGQIRNNVRLIQSVGMMFPEEIINAGQNDVCIAYMFPRYAHLSVSIVKWMKRQKVKTIIISSTGNNSISQYADILLPCSVRSTSFKNSFAAPICLSNYISAAAAQQNYDTSMRLLEETEDILNQGFYLGK